MTSITLAYGPERTVGLAHLMYEVKAQMEKHEFAIGTTRSSIDVYKVRSENFVEAAGQYQKVLLNYRNVVKTNPTSRMMLARQRVARTFTELQTKLNMN